MNAVDSRATNIPRSRGNETMSIVALGWDSVTTLLIALPSVDGVVVLAGLDWCGVDVVWVEGALSGTTWAFWDLLTLLQHGRVHARSECDPWEGVCFSGEEGESGECSHAVDAIQVKC